jgi:hypothetical protein
MRKLIITGMALAMLAIPAASMAAPAKDTAYTTTSVGSCSGGQPGSINIDNGVATFDVPQNGSFGTIRVPQTNLKLKDIKRLSFKSNSSAGGMVYMSVVTNVPGSTTGATHKVKYTPFAQSTPESGIGEWTTHDPLTSGVRLNDVDDTTPAITWADAVSAYGNETVNRVSITAGCALGSGTVQVDRMQVNNSVIGFNQVVS